MQQARSNIPSRRRLEDEGDGEDTYSLSSGYTGLWDSVGDARSTASSGSGRQPRERMRKRFKKHAKQMEAFEEVRSSFEHIQVGRVPHGTRKISKEVKFSQPSVHFSEFLHLFKEELQLTWRPEDYCFMRANDAAQMKHLRYFDREPSDMVEEAEGHMEKAERIVASYILDGRQYPFPVVDEIDLVPFKPNKYPGYEYAMEGFHTRKEADERASVDAKRAFELLLAGDHVEPHKVRLGGRGKVVNMPESEAKLLGVVKGRLILMLSQRDLKILGVTEKQITTHCKAEDIPIWVGKSFFCTGSEKLMERLRGAKRCYCFDAEKFDAAIEPWMVDKAIAIVRQLFVNGEDAQYDTYWAFVKESLIAAPIIRDDGVVFYKRVGTTSGHSHNSVFQSIITLLVGWTSLAKLNPNLEASELVAKAELLSLGDDNLLAVYDEALVVECEDVGDVAWQLCRINWMGEKSFATARQYDWVEGEFQGIQFLGKYFRVLRLDEEYREVQTDEEAKYITIAPYRPIEETLTRLYYPERPPTAVALRMFTEGQLEYMRAVGHYIDAAGNTESRHVVDKYLDYLESQGYQMATVMDKKTQQIIFGDADEGALPLMELRRFAWEDWCRLLLGDRQQVIEMLKFGDGQVGVSVDMDTEDVEQDWDAYLDNLDYGFVEL